MEHAVIRLVLGMYGVGDQILPLNLTLPSENQNIDDVRKYIIVICKYLFR